MGTDGSLFDGPNEVVRSEGSLSGGISERVGSDGSLFDETDEVVPSGGSLSGGVGERVGSDGSLFDGTDEVVSSDGSLPGGIGAAVGFACSVSGATGTDVSSVGRGRGKGVSDRAGNELSRCAPPSVPVARVNQLETSCAISDRGDRTSVGAGDGACASTDAAPSVTRDRDKVAAFRIRTCTVPIVACRTSYQTNGNEGSAQAPESTASNHFPANSNWVIDCPIGESVRLLIAAPQFFGRITACVHDAFNRVIASRTGKNLELVTKIVIGMRTASR